jgi:hypothetical protein
MPQQSEPDPTISDITQSLLDMQKIVSEIAGRWVEAIGQALNKFDWARVADTLFAVAEYAENATRVEAAFTAVNLVPSLSMDRGIVDRVIATHEAGASQNEICAMVLSFYDEAESANVKAIVDRVELSPHFASRSDVLRDVLSAHRSGLDSITTYPLVAMIEGVLITALIPYVNDPKTELRHNMLAQYFLETPAIVALDVGLAPIISIVAFMEGSLYHSSNWWDDEEIRRNYVELNRHRLLHGMAERGTRMNTLRCFLILDLIAEILPRMCAALDEHSNG